MKRLSAVIICIATLGLLSSVLSCTRTVYITTTPTPTSALTGSGRIASFLIHNPAYSLLSEEKSIFEEYSYLESTKEGLLYGEWVIYMNQKCALRMRAVNNLDALSLITPPSELAEFWSMLVKCESINCGSNMNSGVLPLLCEATSSCVGGGLAAPIADWLGQEVIKRNVEAWIKLTSICREHSIDMPWSLPVVYQ